MRVSVKDAKSTLPVTHSNLKALVAAEMDLVTERIRLLEANSRASCIILQDMRVSLNNYMYNSGEIDDTLYELVGNLSTSINNVEKMYDISVDGGADRDEDILTIEDQLVVHMEEGQDEYADVDYAEELGGTDREVPDRYQGMFENSRRR